MGREQLSADFRNLERMLGKKISIQVHVETLADCASCGYNPITKQGTNPQCPACGGRGKTLSEKRIKIPAFVQQNRSANPQLSGGINEEGDLLLYVDFRTVTNFSRFLNGRCRVYVDGVQYEIMNSLKTGIYNNDVLIYTCQKVES